MKFLLPFIFLGLSQIAFAQDDHTPDYCAVNNIDVCAHAGHMENFTSQGESKFVVHVSKSFGKAVEQMDVKLMMEMGNGHSHGTAPVQLTQFAPNKFKVDKAYFVMSGQWTIQLFFKIDGQIYNILIPVVIK